MTNTRFSTVLASVVIFCSVLHVSLTLSALSGFNNIVQCPDSVASNRSLYLTNVFEEGSFLQRKVRKINFPEVGHNPYKITCLKVTDQDSRGKGGTARVASGGYGSYDVEIILRSYLGGDINYRIELWSEE